MPWTVAHPAAPGGKAPGQHGGWLGKAYDPFRVEGDPNAPDFRVEGLGLPDGITADRLGGRRALRDRIDRAPGSPGPAPAPGTATATGARLAPLGRGRRRLPDRSRGPAAPRPLRAEHPRPVPAAGPPPDRGGRPAGDGQLARRPQNFWDTHGDNFNQLKNRLMPPADRGSPPCSTTWTPAACSTRRWSSGSASSAASRRSPRATPAASTGRTATAPSWPAPASAAGRSTAPPTAGPPTRPATRSAPTTSAPRSSTPSASTRRPRSATRRPAAPDQLRQPPDDPVRLAATGRLAPGGSRPARPPTLARFRASPAPSRLARQPHPERQGGAEDQRHRKARSGRGARPSPSRDASATTGRAADARIPPRPVAARRRNSRERLPVPAASPRRVRMEPRQAPRPPDRRLAPARPAPPVGVAELDERLAIAAAIRMGQVHQRPEGVPGLLTTATPRDTEGRVRIHVDSDPSCARLRDVDPQGIGVARPPKRPIAVPSRTIPL